MMFIFVQLLRKKEAKGRGDQDDGSDEEEVS